MSNLGNKYVMSKNIKYYLKINHQTRREVSNALGFPYSTFTDWCNGNVYPRIDKIEIMAKYWHIEKSDLIEEHCQNELEKNIEHNMERWKKELGNEIITDDEMTEIINFAKYIISKRSDK